MASASLYGVALLCMQFFSSLKLPFHPDIRLASWQNSDSPKTSAISHMRAHFEGKSGNCEVHNWMLHMVSMDCCIPNPEPGEFRGHVCMC